MPALAYGGRACRRVVKRPLTFEPLRHTVLVRRARELAMWR